MIAEFREWLEENHVSERELQVGFYKKNSGRFNYSRSEAVDAAICYGWIDAVFVMRLTRRVIRCALRRASRRASGRRSNKVEELWLVTARNTLAGAKVSTHRVLP